MKGDSYQHFMPYQVPDFDARARDLNWWQWLLFCVAVPIVFVYFILLIAWEWVRYRGKSDFVPGMAKYNYRVKPEKGERDEQAGC